MNLLEFIDKGGIIVYILIFLNIIGFTIIIWKFTTLPQVNKTIAKIASRLDFNHSINAQIEYEVKKLESGLVPTIFSGGIAVALITTIAGIIVSIPHQIAYNHFISLVDKIEIKAKKELVKEENR